MKFIIPIALVAAILIFWLGSARAEPLAVGAKAPTPTAPDENGAPVDFGKVYKKGITLVYFYPKAGTSGCTAQACSLRDSISELTQLGVTVLGVSDDTPEAQKKFKAKHNLPFTLIADHKGTVVKAFGVPTILFGVPKRQSFLIKDGTVVWRSLSAQTAGHADEVRKAVASLK